MRRRWRWLRWALAGLALVLLAATAVMYRRIRSEDDLQPAQPADAIIVLGAGLWQGNVGRCYRPRLEHALGLYRAGMAPRIIVTELSPAAEMARSYLRARDVPDGDIVLENRSRSTAENLSFSRAIMETQGWRSAIVVTCPFHVYRSRRMAADLGLDVQMAAAPDSPTESSRWRHIKYTLREIPAWVRWRLLKR